MHPHAEIVYNWGKITKKRVSRHSFSLVYYIMNSECIRVCIYTLDCGIKYCCRSMDLLPTNLRKTELSLCVHMLQLPVFRLITSWAPLTLRGLCLSVFRGWFWLVPSLPGYHATNSGYVERAVWRTPAFNYYKIKENLYFVFCVWRYFL